MLKNLVLKIRSAIETAVNGVIDDATALETPTLFPVWDESATYVSGDRVRYNSVLYKCLQDHTAQPAWTPADAPSLWTKVLIEDPNIIPEWERPDSTNPYQIGDRVTHNGKVWESIVADNVWEPGVYGWAEVEDEKTEDDKVDDSGDNGEEDASGSDAGDNVPGDEDVGNDYTNVPEWEQRYGDNPYMTGDRVLYNGNVYECTYDGNTYSPDTYPAGWKLIS